MNYKVSTVCSETGFEGWSWVLIASVPDLCILFTLIISKQTLVNVQIFRHLLHKCMLFVCLFKQHLFATNFNNACRQFLQTQ